MVKKVKRRAAGSVLTPHIRYESPYGGHAILRRKGRDAYEAVAAFLRSCTDWDGTWPEGKICGQPPDEFIEPDTRNSKILADIGRKLGKSRPGITMQVVDSHADFKVMNSTTERTWAVPAAHHDWAVERMLEAPPARRGWPDALSYTCSVSFRLRDPETGRLLPGQSAKGSHLDMHIIRSGLQVTISSGNTSAFFDFVLPFAEPGAEFVGFIGRIRKLIPIRLAKGNFKLYVPNKAGTGFVKRRVDAALLADI